MLILLASAWLGTAAAAETPALPPDDYNTLPWRNTADDRWEEVDLKASRLSRIGGALSVVGPPILLAGSLMFVEGAYGGSPSLVGNGAILIIPSTAAVVLGPPMLLAGGVRARKSLVERGINPPVTNAVFGWTMLGLGVATMPSPPIGISFCIGAVVAGYLQLHTNRRYRRAAGAPEARMQGVAAMPWVGEDTLGMVVAVGL